MMTVFIFTKYAQKRFLKLPKDIQNRMVTKLKELKKHTSIFTLIQRLTDFEPATHKLRIGNYRLILKLKTQDEFTIEFLVLDIGHRKDIYRSASYNQK